MKFVVITILFLLALLTLSFILTQLLAFGARRKLPAEGRFTEVKGGKIHWTEQGEGKTIILIHGLGGSDQNGGVQFAFAKEDYTLRAEPEDVLSAVKKLK